LHLRCTYNKFLPEQRLVCSSHDLAEELGAPLKSRKLLFLKDIDIKQLVVEKKEKVVYPPPPPRKVTSSGGFLSSLLQALYMKKEKLDRRRG